MSYAIIRNAKMKMGALSGADKHNERKNENYSNQDIDQERTKDNYHLVKPQKGYKKEFDRIREEENLKGNLRLTGEKQSNVACEFLITSDNAFFKNLDEERTKEFFEDSLEFVKNKVGEKHIISAVVHLDETTPHMHITYIPVVEKANKKGIVNKRINCSEFWKGFNSYGILQDDFYKHCLEKGYNLERGEVRSTKEHLDVINYKVKTAKEELENTSQRLTEAQEEVLETKGFISAMMVEYDTKKAYIDACNELSEAAFMIPEYAKVKKNIFGKEFVTVPIEMWRQKHISVNEISALKSYRRDTETEINNFLRSPYAGKIKFLKSRINELESMVDKTNATIEKVNDTLLKLPKDIREQFLEIYENRYNKPEKNRSLRERER